MKNRNSLLRAFKTIGLVLTLGASMTACGFGSDKWKEEVPLSDGRTIVVERELIREGGGDEWASNRGGSKPKEYRIRFAHPDGSGQMIEWRSTKISPQTYPETPLVVDIVAGKPAVFTLVAIAAGGEAYSKYVYQNGAWIEEPLPEQFEQRATNLLFGTHKDLPALVTLEEKNKRNDDIGYRKSLKHVGPNRTVKFT